MKKEAKLSAREIPGVEESEAEGYLRCSGLLTVCIYMVAASGIWTELKGSVHKPVKCSMCSFEKTRLKFTRFIRDFFLQILGLHTFVIFTPSVQLVDCRYLIMAALWNMAGHYIFVLWFLLRSSFFFSSPNLSGRRLDVYHTSIPMVWP